MKSEAPSPNGGNGPGQDRRSERGPGGRFAPGNAGGPGNPHAKRVAEMRGALLAALKPEDFTAIARRLVESALAGEGWAVRELFDRTLGKPIELDIIERLEAMEAALSNFPNSQR